MALSAGSSLGSYEITGSLGAGGMGEVYRARDTRLGRQVAIKVLPEVFLSDADRVARFEREAKMLAALNHPRIAALHSMEEASGRHFLVMELVEGETLAERLRRGPLPETEALRIALQMAEALEAAHDRGIIHRDLKPANVKLTEDGTVKVLDFGLAKAVESPSQAADVANSPTLSMMASQAGLIMGTAAYMSPEQAKGLPADQRSDIFSFGTILYEMLTGRSPFQGETAPDILASVLVREPDLRALPPRIHPRTAEVVRRCLEKPAKRRWQASGDLRLEIEAILASPSQVGPATDSPVSRWRSTRPLPLVLAGITGGALTAAVLILTSALRSPVTPAEVARFTIVPPQGQLLSALNTQVVAISPDGTHIAYTASGGLWVRAMSELEPRLLRGPVGGVSVANAVFAPDGRTIVFWEQDRTLKRIAVQGGAAVPICKAENPLGLSWGPDGIVFGQPAGIVKVSLDSGTPELIVRAAPGEILHGPQWLPGGKAVLFTIVTGLTPEQWDRATIAVQTIASGARTRIIEGGADARYVPTGHIVYAVGGTLLALPFDVGRLKTTGSPVPIVEGVNRAMSGATGSAQFSFSENGTLVYVPGAPGGASALFDLGLTDRKGSIEPLRLPLGPYAFPRVSPDGRRIAVTSDEGPKSAVSIHEMAGTTAIRRLTFGGASRYGIWSHDSQRVAFQSDREGDPAIFVQRADGNGPVERLTKPAPGTSHIPDDWSPDGKHLLYTVQKGTRFEAWVLSVPEGTAAPFSRVASTALPTSVFSPDGHWAAYSLGGAGTSDTSVNIEPFPATGARYQLYAKTGENPHHPRWASGGKELLYVPRVGGFEAVTVTTTPSFAFGIPSQVPRGFPVAAPTTPRTYDVLADGRIVSVIASGQTTPGRTQQAIQVVLSWFEDLKARAK